jgi:hypothetical protein
MNSSERPGLVHRIDKDTSGLLVIAKTEVAMSHLAKQFEAKTSEREYALVWGNVVAESGTIEGNVARHVKTVCKWLFLLILGKASSYPLQGVGTFWLCDVDFLPAGNKNTSNSRSFKAYWSHFI